MLCDMAATKAPHQFIAAKNDRVLPATRRDDMDLDEVRAKIDETDIKIRELLVMRMELSAAAAAVKSRSGKATLDSSREEAILNKTRESSPKDTAEYLVSIYREILRQSKAYQEALRNR